MKLIHLLFLAATASALPLAIPQESPCDRVCPMDFTPVCGTNGMTFSNACALAVHACKHPQLGLRVAGQGPCPTAPDGQRCQGMETVCPETYEPVCASNGVTFRNLCGLAKAVLGNPELRLVGVGECRMDGQRTLTTKTEKPRETATGATERPKTTEKPKETLKTTERPKETSRTTEKPKETSKTTATERPKETLKTTEKPKETSKTTQKPKETLKTTEEPKETSKTTEKPKETSKTTEKPKETSKTTEKSKETSKPKDTKTTTTTTTLTPPPRLTLTRTERRTELTTTRPRTTTTLITTTITATPNPNNRFGDACDRFCPAIYRPVCASDGRTYENDCVLEVAACRNPAAGIKYVRAGGCK
ncbi:hypothetical protein HDU96_010279 [Phlyctochytrium bullatum]|nr:hypothetical protein HDU96_010279 [Phlyctochytrium bullatum]